MEYSKLKRKTCTTCDHRCPTFREIEKIRNTCQKCAVCKASSSMQCGGRGVVYLDGAETSADGMFQFSQDVQSVEPEVYRDGEEDAAPRGITPLPEDVENRLRLLFANLIGMNPLQVMVLHHLANGGKLGNFNEYVQGFNSYWEGRAISDKRAVWAVFKQVTLKVPELDTLFVRYKHVVKDGKTAKLKTAKGVRCE